jgi:hypothetical protein
MAKTSSRSNIFQNREAWHQPFKIKMAAIIGTSDLLPDNSQNKGQ